MARKVTTSPRKWCDDCAGFVQNCRHTCKTRKAPQTCKPVKMWAVVKPNGTIRNVDSRVECRFYASFDASWRVVPVMIVQRAK